MTLDERPKGEEVEVFERSKQAAILSNVSGIAKNGPSSSFSFFVKLTTLNEIHGGGVLKYLKFRLSVVEFSED